MQKYFLWYNIVFLTETILCANQHVIDSLETQLKNHNSKKIEFTNKISSLYDLTAAKIYIKSLKHAWLMIPTRHRLYQSMSCHIRTNRL